MFYLFKGLKDNKSSDKGSSKDQDYSNTQCDVGLNVQSTVRTIESEKTEPIIIGKDKLRNRSEKYQSRENKSKIDKPKESKRKKADRVKQEVEIKEKKKVFKDCSLVRSLSDPQSSEVLIRTDKKKVQMISVEKSEDDINGKHVKLPSAYKERKADMSTSDSESDSGKSLLCSLAPKWLSVGNLRQKRQVKKKASQEHQIQQSSAGKAEIYTIPM